VSSAQISLWPRFPRPSVACSNQDLPGVAHLHQRRAERAVQRSPGGTRLVTTFWTVLCHLVPLARRPYRQEKLPWARHGWARQYVHHWPTPQSSSVTLRRRRERSAPQVLATRLERRSDAWRFWDCTESEGPLSETKSRVEAVSVGDQTCFIVMFAVLMVFEMSFNIIRTIKVMVFETSDRLYIFIHHLDRFRLGSRRNACNKSPDWFYS